MVATALTFLIGYGGATVYYRKAKTILKEFSDVILGISDLLNELNETISDDEVTPEEIRSVIDKSKYLIEQYHEFINTIRGQ
ncbi:MAG: hypothetical protein DRJ47_06265 [Thermoprotei archaeon]|nr:MAG: hypothetical protein DRJ47_06265 [Thermoprotei archaeon]